MICERLSGVWLFRRMSSDFALFRVHENDKKTSRTSPSRSYINYIGCFRLTRKKNYEMKKLWNLIAKIHEKLLRISFYICSGCNILRLDFFIFGDQFLSCFSLMTSNTLEILSLQSWNLKFAPIRPSVDPYISL